MITKAEKFSNQNTAGIFDDTWSRMESILLPYRFIVFLLLTKESILPWRNKQMWSQVIAEAGYATYQICIAVFLMTSVLWNVKFSPQNQEFKSPKFWSRHSFQNSPCVQVCMWKKLKKISVQFFNTLSLLRAFKLQKASIFSMWCIQKLTTWVSFHTYCKGLKMKWYYRI